MNSVNLIGRITNDLVLKDIGTGKVVNFSLAINSKKDKAVFVNVTAFNQIAENLVKYQKKGSLIGLGGYLQDNSYTDKNGNNVYTLKVMATNIEYLGGTNKEDKADENKVTFNHNNDFKLVPQLDDDDIPF